MLFTNFDDLEGCFRDDIYYSSNTPGNDFKQVTSCSTPIMNLQSPLECQEKCRKCPDCRFFEYRQTDPHKMCKLYETSKPELVGFPPDSNAAAKYPPDNEISAWDTPVLSTGPQVCGKHVFIELVISILSDSFYTYKDI